VTTPTATVRVIYGDTDQMGVVYYANYLRYFEIGRAEWLRARGGDYRLFERSGFQLPVVEAQVRYRSPARYDDVIAIDATPIETKAATVRFSYRLNRVGDGELLAEGYTIHACIGSDGKPKRFPPEMAALLKGAT
jgi:acyl-CoA thioester hydrolase